MTPDVLALGYINMLAKARVVIINNVIDFSFFIKSPPGRYICRKVIFIFFSE